MALADSIPKLKQTAERVAGRLDTEEATKMSLVVPLLRELGFDPFDPDVVVPEFTADVGTKNGEKVDYALKQSGKIIMLIECKTAHTNLNDAHFGQLFRYFSVTEARVGVLTNGIEYWFFSDVDEKNKLDNRPFYRFSLLDHNDADLKQLEQFTSRSFDPDHFDETASLLKYTTLLKKEIRQELDNPSEDLIKLFASKVYSGRLTANAREMFAPLVFNAFNEIIREIVNSRLTHALSQVNSDETKDTNARIDEANDADENKDGIFTTDQEREAFFIVKSIARRFVDADRISMRDQKSYCNVLLDNTNRKPVVRFLFDNNPQRIQFGKDPNQRVEIAGVDDLFKYEEAIKLILAEYDGVTY